jgi:tetratricopeptide (TPR) repeat protein
VSAVTRRWLIAGVVIGSSVLMFAARPFVRPAAPDEERTAGGEPTGPAREFWALYREATTLRAAGDCGGAVVAYQKALALRPDHEDALYYLGNCHLERRRYAEALQAYRRLAAVNPAGSSRGYMQGALIFASLDPEAPYDLPQAEEMFRRALEVDQDSGAVLGLAEVAILKGQWQEARRRLETVEAENPMSVAAPYLRGYLAFRRGERDEAWRSFRVAVGRAEIKKPGVKWTEEGDVKADPALRWRALARQSVFGAHWVRVRAYVAPPGPRFAEMEREYRQLDASLAARRR